MGSSTRPDPFSSSSRTRRSLTFIPDYMEPHTHSGTFRIRDLPSSKFIPTLRTPIHIFPISSSPVLHHRTSKPFDASRRLRGCGVFHLRMWLFSSYACGISAHSSITQDHTVKVVCNIPMVSRTPRSISA
jgi:hypothetical protein